MQDKSEVLFQYYGYREFRPGQEALIDAQLTGRDVLGIMPTGGGKSICYQLPALLLDGITLVISPLISLMKDQVTALSRTGIPAAYLNSSLSWAQLQQVLRNLGQYKIIYVAPERLLSESFLVAISQVKIALLAVDEAHCISQWGQDFRPSYLQITEFLSRLPYRPVISAFTATATQAVREDILRILRLQNPLQITTGYDRPNLHFSVIKKGKKADTLLRLIHARPDKSGIVYCATRKDTEKICDLLLSQGISATRYHAGLPEGERHSNQDDFIRDRRRVMVATNAFGMGIDKSNVAYVIHYNMPQSMEAYYQEAGRAGRDGEKADCILLFSQGDIRTAKYFIQNPGENETITPELRAQIQQQDLRRLEVMIGYCSTTACLRCYILDYFGEITTGNCGNCSNCQRHVQEQDITREAQMILSCVQRIYHQLGYALGATAVIRVLHGSREKRLLELHLQTLSTYGIMRQIPRAKIRELMEALEAQGYLLTDHLHGSISATQKAAAVLFQGQRVSMAVEIGNEDSLPRPAAEADSDALFETLKALRLKLATQEQVPPYIIFSNATLQDMARKAPSNPEAFLEVTGVGRYKAERYGDAFLSAILKFGETT